MNDAIRTGSEEPVPADPQATAPVQTEPQGADTVQTAEPHTPEPVPATGPQGAGAQEAKRPPRRPGRRLQPVLWLVFLALAGLGFHYREPVLKFCTPPLAGPYQITAAAYHGAHITQEGATFEARFKIKIIQLGGWKRIDLLPSTVAIVKADLPAGTHLVLAGGKYAILTRQTGNIEAAITYSVAVKEAAGGHALEFQRVPSVTCMLDATLADGNAEVTVGGAQSVETERTNGATHVVAALPDNAAVTIAWKKALPKLAEGPSQYHCETKTLVSVGEGLILGQARMDFSILHTASHALDVRVPAGVSVLDVTGKGVRDWRIADGRMTVQLEQDVMGPYPLSVRYEAPFALAAGTIAVPILTGSGVTSEKGSIGIAAMSNLEIRNGKLTDAYAIDAKDLPAEIVGMTAQPVLLAYRYATPAAEVNLAVAKPGDAGVLLTLIDRAAFTIVQTLDGKRVTRASYDVRNHRNQFLRIALPAGAELWSAAVGGRTAQASKDEQGRILLPLVRSPGGAGMSAFPVEIVYAEEGTKPAANGRGTARIDLPVCAEPIMYLAVSLYVPAQGKYSDFTGALRPVAQFSVAAPAAKPVALPAMNQVMNQQAVQALPAVQLAATDAAATELAVPLPVSGTLFRFEKILVVKDQPWLAYGYRNLAM